MISLIIPTYNELENIQIIIPELIAMFRSKNIDGEVIIVDDNSPDGTAKAAERLSQGLPVKVIVRKKGRGLSKAVIEGFGAAKGDICVVMDADMSHPLEKIPEMIRPIMENKCEVTVGSRNIKGGGFDDWPYIRKLISSFAGLLARGVTSISDPTTGFMAFKKEILKGVALDPLGWKIVLEVIVKTNPSVIEVPIVFKDRKLGSSKLDCRVQRDYLHHLWKLYSFRHPLFFKLLGCSILLGLVIIFFIIFII